VIFAKPAKHMALRLPVIVLVVAFTAIPMELRPLTREGLAAALEMNLGVADMSDIVANIIGYVPVGIVLASRGAWPTVGVATAVSLSAEVGQLFSKGRSSSLIDVATNLIGALIGLVISGRWKARLRNETPRIGIDRRTASVAGAVALAYVGLGAGVTPRDAEEAVSIFLVAPRAAWLPANTRGDTTPGQLEAHWTFDRGGEDVTLDVSGNGLNGSLVHGPALVSGVDGRALGLNGVDQYADFGDPTALRLTGSMTISAWINSTSFPADDAAIVSSFNRRGYQLDTTIDRGPRTIGFKLADRWGRFMARYGRTPLVPNRWYHVAGVYDARARTLNVYLNGHSDNGCLLGTVTDKQGISGVDVFVGRRSDRVGFEFAGSIDDVRVYSRALPRGEIEAATKETTPERAVPLSATKPVGSPVLGPRGSDTACASSEAADARTSGLIVAFGILVAVACAGFWPTASYRTACLVLSFAAGFLLFPSVASTLPAYYHWMIPALTLAGGASVAASLRA